MTIEFGTWEAPSTINPYIDTINALNAHVIETGNVNASVTIVVPKGDALKTRQNVAKAANLINRTARVRVNGETVIIDGADTGNVRFVFTLTDRHKPRKGSEYVASNSEDSAPDEEATDAPDEEAATSAPAPSPKGRK